MIAPETLLQNRYLVLKQIGQGGMGAVYLATDQRFGSTVALKETFFTDATLRKAFEREARLLNRLRHPALPNVSDHFVESDGQFLVMEYIPGEDLSEMLKEQGGAFPIKEVMGWADQLLDALDYLHTQESPVIHRDIKPQNLKLTPRGQIILLDFGLAKGSPIQVSQVTASQSVFGYSRNYAPIEQIKGTGTDPRSDLYSLAATLYHLLTGVTPPDALTRASDVLNGQPDPLRPANEVHNQVTPAVAEVLTQALSHNAGQRPQTAAIMREALSVANKQTVVVGQVTSAQILTGTILEQDTQLIGTRSQDAESQKESIHIAEATGNEHQRSAGVETDAVTSRDEPATSTRVSSLGSETTKVKQPVISKRQISGTTIGIAGGLVLLLIAAVVFAMTRPTPPPTPIPATESSNPSATGAQPEQSVESQDAKPDNPLPSDSPNPSVQSSVPPSSTSKETGTQANSKETTAAPVTPTPPARNTRTQRNVADTVRNSNESASTAEQIAEDKRRARAEAKQAAIERQRALTEKRRAEELRRRRILRRP